MIMTTAQLIAADDGVLACLVMSAFGFISYIYTRIILNRKYYKKQIGKILVTVLCEVEFIKSIPTYHRAKTQYVRHTLAFRAKHPKLDKYF